MLSNCLHMQRFLIDWILICLSIDDSAYGGEVTLRLVLPEKGLAASSLCPNQPYLIMLLRTPPGVSVFSLQMS